MKNKESILELKKLDEVDEEKWERLLESSSYSTVYHTLSWCKVWQKTYPQSNFLFTILADLDQNYLLAFPLWEKRNLHLSSFYSLPFGTYGGPIMKEELDTQNLNDCLNKVSSIIRRWNALKTEVADFFNKYDFLKSYGFSARKCFAHLLDLSTLDEENPVKGFDKKRKEGIRQAQRRGVLIKDIESLEEVKRCYELTLNTYRRYGIKKPKYPLLLFENIFSTMGQKNLLKWLVATKDGEIIGSLMSFVFKDMVYAWEGASDYNSENFRPNDALFFHTILWAKKNNFKFFNFGATPARALGMLRFKESWGTFVHTYKVYEQKNRLGRILSKFRKGVREV